MALGGGYAEGSFSSMAADLDHMASSFAQVVSLSAALGLSLNTFVQLEQQLTRTNSVAEGTVTQFNEMEDAVRAFALASDTSAKEAANSLYYLASAGFTVTESLTAMRGVLELAQATMVPASKAADLMAESIRAFGLDAADATRVSNLFVAATTATQSTIEKLTYSLKQVGPVAAQAGLSIEDTVTAVSLLQNVGLRGEQSGTALRNIIVRLVDPVGAASRTLQELNVQTINADGSMRNLQSIMQDLAKLNLSETDIAKIFGRQSVAAAITLINDAGSAWSDLREKITGTQRAFEVAQQQLNTSAGQIILAEHAIQEIAISVGEALSPALRDLTGILQGLAHWWDNLDKGTQQFYATIAATTIAVGTFYLALEKLGIIDGIVAAFGLLVPLITDFAGVLFTVFADARIFGSITALQLALMSFGEAVPILGLVTGAISDFLSSVQQIGIVETIALGIEDFTIALRIMAIDLVELVAPAFIAVTAAIAEFMAYVRAFGIVETVGLYLAEFGAVIKGLLPVIYELATAEGVLATVTGVLDAVAAPLVVIVAVLAGLFLGYKAITAGIDYIGNKIHEQFSPDRLASVHDYATGLEKEMNRIQQIFSNSPTGLIDQVGALGSIKKNAQKAIEDNQLELEAVKKQVADQQNAQQALKNLSGSVSYTDVNNSLGAGGGDSTSILDAYIKQVISESPDDQKRTLQEYFSKTNIAYNDLIQVVQANKGKGAHDLSEALDTYFTTQKDGISKSISDVQKQQADIGAQDQKLQAIIDTANQRQVAAAKLFIDDLQKDPLATAGFDIKKITGEGSAAQQQAQLDGIKKELQERLNNKDVQKLIYDIFQASAGDKTAPTTQVLAQIRETSGKGVEELKAGLEDVKTQRTTLLVALQEDQVWFNQNLDQIKKKTLELQAAVTGDLGLKQLLQTQASDTGLGNAFEAFAKKQDEDFKKYNAEILRSFSGQLTDDEGQLVNIIDLISGQYIYDRMIRDFGAFDPSKLTELVGKQQQLIDGAIAKGLIQKGSGVDKTLAASDARLAQEAAAIAAQKTAADAKIAYDRAGEAINLQKQALDMKAKIQADQTQALEIFSSIYSDDYEKLAVAKIAQAQANFAKGIAAIPNEIASLQHAHVKFDAGQYKSAATQLLNAQLQQEIHQIETEAELAPEKLKQSLTDYYTAVDKTIADFHTSQRQNGQISFTKGLIDLTNDDLAAENDRFATQVSQIKQQYITLKNSLSPDNAEQASILDGYNQQIEAAERLHDTNIQNITSVIGAYQEWKKAMDDNIIATERQGQATNDFFLGITNEILRSQEALRTAWYDLGKQAYDDFQKDFGDAVAKTLTGVEVDWRNMLVNMLQNLAQTQIKDEFNDIVNTIVSGIFKIQSANQAASASGGILSWIANHVFGLGSGATAATGGSTPILTPGGGLAPLPQAMGGAWMHGMQMFAKGDVFDQPTMFRHSGGVGVMGEAGPESIMPLTRTSSGKLGVSAVGTGGQIVVHNEINVTVTGAQSNSSSDNKALGNTIGAAVDKQIDARMADWARKQTRIGGILNPGVKVT